MILMMDGKPLNLVNGIRLFYLVSIYQKKLLELGFEYFHVRCNDYRCGHCKQPYGVAKDFVD